MRSPGIRPARHSGIRASSYLNRVDIGDGTSLLFHGATLCIDLVPTVYADRLTDPATPLDLSFLSPGEKSHLLKRGHLTAWSRRRELAEFRKRVRYVVEKEAELGRKRKKGTLSFVLTYDCNLSCAYCYQKSLAATSRVPAMSEKFAEEVLSRHLPRLFPGVPRKNLVFLFFGGEPLLPGNRATIARILRYAGKHSIKAAVATNGLSIREMEEFIGPETGKIGNVQVVLDGDRLHHDKRRTFGSGKPTYEGIIRAVRRLMRLKVNVFIRVHTHPGKMESTAKLVEYLDRAKILTHPNVETYFAPINTFQEKYGSPAEFDLFRRIFHEVAAKTRRPPSLNLDFLGDVLKMEGLKFLPRTRYCSVGTDDVFIVDPMGDIYDCFEEAGHKERRIGEISGGNVKFFPIKKTHTRRHLLNIPECLQCSVAFFCGGGCPTRARIHGGSIFEPYCLQNKEYIAQTLKAYYSSLRRKIPA